MGKIKNCLLPTWCFLVPVNPEIVISDSCLTVLIFMERKKLSSRTSVISDVVILVSYFVALPNADRSSLKQVRNSSILRAQIFMYFNGISLRSTKQLKKAEYIRAWDLYCLFPCPLAYDSGFEEKHLHHLWHHACCKATHTHPSRTSFPKFWLWYK